MANYEQIIKFEARRKLTKAISTHILYQIQSKLAQLTMKLIERRTDSGYDINSRRFKALTPAYKKLKQRVISGQSKRLLKNKSISLNKSIARLIGRKVPGKAARAISDYMHLTGELFEDIGFNIKKPQWTASKITLPIVITVNERSSKKAEGLVKMGRNMFGLARSGRFVDFERNLLARTMTELFQNKITNAKVIIK